MAGNLGGNRDYLRNDSILPWQGRDTTVTSAATSQRKAAGSTSFTLVSDDEVSHNCYVKCVNHRCLISLANQISFRRDYSVPHICHQCNLGGSI